MREDERDSAQNKVCKIRNVRGRGTLFYMRQFEKALPIR